MPWFVDALLAGADHTDVDRESDVIVGIVPMIVEKVVLPFLIGEILVDGGNKIDFFQMSSMTNGIRCRCVNAKISVASLEAFPSSPR